MPKAKKTTKKKQPIKIEVPRLTDRFISEIVKAENEGKRFGLLMVVTKDGGEEIDFAVRSCLGVSDVQLVSGLVGGIMQDFERKYPDDKLNPSLMLASLFSQVMKKLGLTVIEVE